MAKGKDRNLVNVIENSLDLTHNFTDKYTERWGVNVPLIALDNWGAESNMLVSFTQSGRGEISRSSGTPLELALPTSARKRRMGHSNQMDMVKTCEIGRPACLPPKSAMAAHGGASETERISVDDEDLASPRRCKVQSILLRDGQGDLRSLSENKILK